MLRSIIDLARLTVTGTNTRPKVEILKMILFVSFGNNLDRGSRFPGHISEGTSRNDQ